MDALADLKQELLETEEELTAQLHETEDQLHETEDQLQETTDNLEAANTEIQRLITTYEDRIASLLNYYVGRKNDTVDEALESWMKTAPEKEKMKIMFLRESEGVY